jgi:hypothetical protein
MPIVTIDEGGVRATRAGRVAERFVCEISGHGPRLDDPLAGDLPPTSDMRAERDSGTPASCPAAWR